MLPSKCRGAGGGLPTAHICPLLLLQFLAPLFYPCPTKIGCFAAQS